jgi:hypothetical protein
MRPRSSLSGEIALRQTAQILTTLTNVSSDVRYFQHTRVTHHKKCTRATIDNHCPTSFDLICIETGLCCTYFLYKDGITNSQNDRFLTHYSSYVG